MSLDRAPEVDVRAELEALRREIERLRVEKLHDRTLLDAVLRFSPHGILVADPSGRIFLQNEAAERIWAGSATTTSVSDWAAYRAFHPDGRPYEPADWPMARCLAEGATIEAQRFDILRFDGTRGRLVGSSAPLRDDEGRITGAVSIFVDVTELQRSEEARTEREHRYRQLLDSVQDMVFCKDRDLRVVYANRATTAYYGLTEAELKGITDVAHNDRDFTDQYLRDDLRVLETGEPVEVAEEPNVSPSGEVQYFHTIKSPVRDAAGRIIEIVGVSRNITERRRSDLRLRAHHALTRLLAEGEGLEELLPRLLETIAGGLEAAAAAYWKVEDTGTLRCTHFWGGEARVAPFEEASRRFVFARGEGLPGQVWASGEARWVEDIGQRPAYCRQEEAVACGLVTTMAFPVVARGDILGVVEVLLAKKRPPDEDVLRTIATMGAQMGMFARRARERAQRDFLARASEMFARSLDPLATLAELTRLAVPRLGDWCAADMLDAEGRIARLAVHHSDPEKVELAQEIVRRWPPDPSAPNGVPHVLRTGRSELVPAFPDEALDAPGVDPEAAAIVRKLGLRSYVVVPLTSRGRTLGALTLVHAESGRRFNENDLAVAEELATRAALAIDNARLYADAEAARQHLASLFSHAPAPVLVVWGPEHRIELANAAWCELAGRSDVIGRRLAECVPADWLGLVPGVSGALASAEPRVVHEQPCRTPSGEQRWFNLVYQPMKAGDGRAGVMVLGADVTAQVEARRREEAAQQALREERAALQRSNADLDQFAYVASHDLKAPLRGIANLSTWIEEDLAGALTGDTGRHLELLRGRVKRMESLIDGILDYSRAGRVRSEAEEVDTRALVKDVVDLVSPRSQARIRVAGELPRLRTERVPLQQVLLNLVANALKHGGKPDLEVTVSASDEGGHVEFRVADDGIGIAPEYHERIWGIFQTLEARDKVESTGIGLALVKKIVESRGGRVRVESAPGQGACFVFTWPKTTAEVRRP